jgi:hypothetical protein
VEIKMRKKIILFFMLIPLVCFSQVDNLSRLNNLSDLRLCLHFAGLEGDQYANLELFKKRLLSSRPDTQEALLQSLEAADIQARDFLLRQREREDGLQTARQRLMAIDLDSVQDPVLKDLIFILQR